MNEFCVELQKFVGQFDLIQSEETEINEKAKMLDAKRKIKMEDFGSFLKSHGLPDNFTLPQALALAVTKSRD